MRFCSELQTTGTCRIEDCDSSHDITLFCFECNVMSADADSKSAHLRGKRHQNMLRYKRRSGTAARDRYCDTCNVPISVGREAWRVHIQGARHQRRLQAANDPQPGPSIPDEFYEYCHVCKRSFTSNLEYDAHKRSAEHKAGLRVSNVAATPKNAQTNGHGISISPGDNVINFGLIDCRALKGNPTRSSALSVVASTAHIRIIRVRFLSTQTFQSLGGVFSAGCLLPALLKKNVPSTVTISFWPGTSLGQLSDVLELVFEDTAQKQSFTVFRRVCAEVGVEDDDKVLPPTVTVAAPYVRRPRPPFSEIENPIPGPKPPQAQSIPYSYRFPDYPLDESLLTVGSLDQRIAATEAVLPNVLNGETYKQYWSTLLHVEEGQMNVDIEAYDLEEVPLEPYQSFYYLEVAGLGEGRPSVAIGDSVHIRLRRNPQQWFEGRVYVVQEKEIGMKFDSSFIYRPNDLCDARFTINRTITRCLHYALDKAFFPDRILFPSLQYIEGLTRPSGQEIAAIRPFNRMVRSNMRQLEAVTAIVNLPPGSVPFVVFGPPGTGKTTTIVEAIRQVLDKDPSTTILACAPSNSAADRIAQHLLDLGPRQVFRLNAPSRWYSHLSDDLRDFSYKDPDGHFSVRSKEDLESYRVVVSTCLSASIPERVGMETGHFSHIFVDDAGLAMEPEIMVPIKTIANPSTNIVLAGDPQQLGPTIRSDVINRLGLGMSYLNRLVGREIYDYRTHSGVTIVKLVKNYRSHPAILKFPNDTFYNGELEVCGRPEIIISHLDSPVLARSKFPVVFHGVAGSDDREAGSPSYFNLDEISIIYKYVDQLRTDRKTRLTDNDIGIISPYHAQGKKIRECLEAQYEGIKVGSVEEFQGQERRVILISTVRSSQDKAGYDLKHLLGFLLNPRQMNVAINYAQALLIIVGNPLILGIDPLWRLFINYIHQNGGWKGLQPNWNVKDNGFGDDFRGLGASTQMVDPAGWTVAEILTQNVREALLSEIQGGDAVEEDYDAERLEASQERPFERDE